MTGGSPLNPIVARALRASVRPRALLGLVGAALLVLASARGLAPDPNVVTGLRVTPRYVGLCLAELYALLVVVTITAAAAIASERQERTWDALAASALSDTELVLGKAVAVLLPAAQLALLLVLAHLVYGIVWGAPWSFIVSVQFVFLGTVMGAAGLSLLCSAVCDRVVHAVALAAAAIVLGWFVALDGLARTWTITRFARVGHPLRLLDDLTTSSVTVEAAGLRALAFLLARWWGWSGMSRRDPTGPISGPLPGPADARPVSSTAWQDRRHLGRPGLLVHADRARPADSSDRRPADPGAPGRQCRDEARSGRGRPLGSVRRCLGV